MKSTASDDLARVYQLLNPPPVLPVSWKTPLRPAVHALRAFPQVREHVRQCGPGVVRSHEVGLPKQVLALLRQLGRGFTSEDFYRFRMYSLPHEQASLFVPLLSNIRVRSALYRRLGLDPDALADKRRFGRSAASAGLPVPETIADFENGEIRWWGEKTLPPCDLFVKEAAAMCGQGAMLWRWDGVGRWHSQESSLGSSLGADELLSCLARESTKAPLLLQRRVTNHADLADLGPQGLCTVRVVTLRAPDSPRAEILLAAFRMPTGTDVADNFARGGLACAVDSDTGTLGPAVYKALQRANLDAHRHPDTSGVIAGRRLPCWEETIGLALRAHEVYSQYPSIGWDVALSPRGPVLLEANYNWDVVLAQQAGCRPLGATKWPQHILQWVRWAETKKTAQPRSDGHGAFGSPA